MQMPQTKRLEDSLHSLSLPQSQMLFWGLHGCELSQGRNIIYKIMSHMEKGRERKVSHIQGQWGTKPCVLMATASCHWKTHSSELLVKKQGEVACGTLIDTWGFLERQKKSRFACKSSEKGQGICVKAIPRAKPSSVAVSWRGAGSSSVCTDTANTPVLCCTICWY